jgi:hypothetical protein
MQANQNTKRQRVPIDNDNIKEKPMSNNPDHNPSGRAQLRADLSGEQQHEQPRNRLPEQEAVRTTIVGGRPPGSGKPMGNVPRGIEVLLKKAAIDKEFRELLLNDPEAAAGSIALELTPVEQAMLKAMPAEHLAVIINQTEVPQPQRRAFLGTAAAAMLAVLTGSLIGCPDDTVPTKGTRPDDRHDWVGGAAPDFPDDVPPFTSDEGNDETVFPEE